MSIRKGWTEANIGDFTVPKVEQAEPTAEVPYVDIGSIDRDRKLIGTLEKVDRASAPARARQWVLAGDVLVSMTRPNLNAVALISDELSGSVASTGFDVLRPIGVLPKWLFARVRCQEFVNDLCKDIQGVVYPAIRPDDVRRHRMPIAPLQEQQRIVDALDSYLSRLDAAVASLERVQSKLKAYRASVLKAAVEGRLVPTEAELARAEKRDYEPASVLLDRILKERRRRWEEAELGRLIKAGKAPKDEKWKAKYEEPAPPDTSKLPELPEGWCWASVAQMGEVTGGLTKNAARDRVPHRIAYLRVANVYANRLELDEIKEIGVDNDELPRVLVEKGDLLVVEGNGSVEQLGRVAMWDGSIAPIVHQNHLIKVRTAVQSSNRWILTWLLSPYGRATIEQVASSTSGLHTLSISKVGNLPVALPPCVEQARILDAVDEGLSQTDTAEVTVDTNTFRITRLRQSILKWAFEGKLVDQDPSDEPAADLLARIRAERATAPTQTRARGKKAKSS